MPSAYCSLLLISCGCVQFHSLIRQCDFLYYSIFIFIIYLEWITHEDLQLEKCKCYIFFPIRKIYAIILQFSKTYLYSKTYS